MLVSVFKIRNICIHVEKNIYIANFLLKKNYLQKIYFKLKCFCFIYFFQTLKMKCHIIYWFWIILETTIIKIDFYVFHIDFQR